MVETELAEELDDLLDDDYFWEDDFEPEPEVHYQFQCCTGCHTFKLLFGHLSVVSLISFTTAEFNTQ